MRSRRRALPWTPILWVACAATYAAGISTSPLTVLRKVRVDGIGEEDSGRIVALLREVEDRPALQISASPIEAAACARPDVKRARFRRNVFGAASLELEYYRPIALVDDSYRGCLSPEGLFFQAHKKQAGLPQVHMPRAAQGTQATLMGVVSPAVLAKLATEAQSFWPQGETTVEVDEAGSYNMVREGTLIRLGTSDEMDEKLTELRRLLETQSDLLMKYKSVNLMSPKSPKGVPR